jgi:minor tail protein
LSEREASVKLTLDGAQFMIAIKKVGDDVDKTSARGKKSITALGAGINSAKKSMQELGGVAKRTLGMVATFGGAFSVGTAIKGAVQLQATYSDLAYGIERGTGQLMRAADVQKIVERSAAKTSRTNEEMAQTFGDLFDATGDLDFSRKAIDAIGTTATATGIDLATLTTTADQLHTKFGVSADGMLDAFGKVYELGKKGGPKFAEFSDVMSGVGAEMLAAGLSGEKGLNFMLGALVETDDAFKSLPKQVRGLQAVLRGLGEKGELAKLAQKVGLDPKKLINEKDALSRLRSVLGKGKKGVDALLAPLHEGEEKQTMKILFTDPFEKALADANASGLKGKAALDKALSVFDERIGDFGKATTGAAELQRKANERAQEPQAKLRAALNDLTTAFGQPEIISAINDLAKHLPDLAKIIGDVVRFAIKNPIAAGGVALGGKVGVDFLGGAAQSIINSHLAGGTGASAKVKEGLEGAGRTVAGDLKTSLGSVSGVMGAAGTAFGIAATAYLALNLGQALIDQMFGGEEAKMKRVEKATGADAPKNAAERDAQVEELAASVEGTKDVGKGFFNSFFGGGARMLSGLKGEGFSPPELDSEGNAEKARKAALERIEELRTQRFGETTVDPRPALAAAKPATVQLDRGTPGMIGVAVATALGGMVLNVRSRGPGEANAGPARAGGGSRGPMVAPPTAPGGGH